MSRKLFELWKLAASGAVEFVSDHDTKREADEALRANNAVPAIVFRISAEASTIPEGATGVTTSKEFHAIARYVTGHGTTRITRKNLAPRPDAVRCEMGCEAFAAPSHARLDPRLRLLCVACRTRTSMWRAKGTSTADAITRLRAEKSKAVAA